MGTPTPMGGSDDRSGIPRRPPSLAPDLVELAERVGRHDWNPAVSADDEADIAASCVLPLAPAAAAEPEAFLHCLADRCLPAGPWAAYGAERLALRLFGPRSGLHRHPAWSDLIDRSLGLHRDQCVPYPLLPMYLAERFEAGGGDPEAWLPFREAPDPGEASITPLRPGETRTVVEGRAGGGVRVVVQQDGTRVIGLVELAAADAGDGRTVGTAGRARVECWRASDLYDLYLDIAWACPSRAWADPELEPFFPGPPPGAGPSGGQAAGETPPASR